MSDETMPTFPAPSADWRGPLIGGLGRLRVSLHLDAPADGVFGQLESLAGGAAEDEAAVAAISELSEAAYILGRESAEAAMIRHLGRDGGSQKALRDRVRAAERDLAILLGVDWAIDEDDEPEDDE